MKGIQVFETIEGPVRLHWESDESEAEVYHDMASALDAVAEAAVAWDLSAEEVERIAYIVSEADYQDSLIP